MEQITFVPFRAEFFIATVVGFSASPTPTLFHTSLSGTKPGEILFQIPRRSLSNASRFGHDGFADIGWKNDLVGIRGRELAG